MSSRKWAQYFVEHPIIVISTFGIGDILTNLNATERVAKWLIKLGPQDIRYDYPKVIKAQVLPDFTTKWIKAQLPGAPEVSNSLTMYFDGSRKK